jgi:hypothetical protein
MLLLDDDEPEEDADSRKRNEEMSENKRRGHSFKPPLPHDRKNSLERHQQSLERKKSIENGVTLPNIANKRSHK